MINVIISNQQWIPELRLPLVKTKLDLRLGPKQHSIPVYNFIPVVRKYDHIVEHSHNFTKEDVAVKHREKDWFRRGVAELIYIAEGRPSLNGDRGRHTLPPIYRQLLSSRNPSDPNTNRELRDDNAETSVF